MPESESVFVTDLVGHLKQAEQTPTQFRMRLVGRQLKQCRLVVAGNRVPVNGGSQWGVHGAGNDRITSFLKLSERQLAVRGYRHQPTERVVRPGSRRAESRSQQPR